MNYKTNQAKMFKILSYLLKQIKKYVILKKYYRAQGAIYEKIGKENRCHVQSSFSKLV